MGKNDPWQLNHPPNYENIIFKSKYKTEYIPREKCHHPIHFNSAPHNKKREPKQDQKSPENPKNAPNQQPGIDEQKEYLRKNLLIKCCVDKERTIPLQTKKVSIRDYKPKVITQEIDMGMWI